MKRAGVCNLAGYIPLRDQKFELSVGMEQPSDVGRSFGHAEDGEYQFCKKQDILVMVYMQSR
jgi:hypothetical protein